MKKIQKLEIGKIFSKIKKLRLPVKIIGIVSILAIGLVIWQPSIVKGEFNFQAIFDRLTQHDQKIDNLEKKVEDTKTQTVSQPAVITEKKVEDTKTQTVMPTSTSATTEPYVPSVCTNIPIPYETVYEDTISLGIGQTSSTEGIDGWTHKCTTSSTGFTVADYTVKPINKIIHVGTGPATTQNAEAKAAEERQERIAQCVWNVNATVPGHSSAYDYAMQICYNIN